VASEQETTRLPVCSAIFKQDTGVLVVAVSALRFLRSWRNVVVLENALMMPATSVRSGDEELGACDYFCL
jgi:hypothetical protein